MSAHTIQDAHVKALLRGLDAIAETVTDVRLTLLAITGDEQALAELNKRVHPNPGEQPA